MIRTVRPRISAAAVCAALAAATLVWTPPAVAHPHVWINAVATFVFERDALTGIRLEWSFDEFFGDFVIHDFGLAGLEGELGAEERALLQDNAFSALSEFDYLTHIRIDGEAVAVADARDFSAAIENGVLVYRFTAALPEPVDPRAHEVSAGLYDDTFYIDVMLDEADPVRFDGLPDGTCRFRIREDEGNAIYFGLVYPLVIDLDCGNV